MPRDKDLKRLTRRRMEKTGESYTAARANLLAKKGRSNAPLEDAPPTTATADPPASDLPGGYAELAGVTDEAIRAKTGRDWRAWVEALDAIGATSRPHREVAAHLHEVFGISGWWAQTLAVGYERIKGLREIGQRLDGDFEATKSKTIAASIDRARRAFSDPDLRARWLPGVTPTPRKTTSQQALRFDWEDGTAIDVWFVAKGETKTQVAIVHRKLQSRADREESKESWGERLAALAALLEAME